MSVFIEDLPAAHHFRESKKTSGGTQETELTKDQEAAELIHWIENPVCGSNLINALI